MSTITDFPTFSPFYSSHPRSQKEFVLFHPHHGPTSPSSIAQIEATACQPEFIQCPSQGREAKKVDPDITFKTFCDAFPVAWVFDFLLTPDPIHIPHLSSPWLVSHSLTSTVSRTYRHGQDGNSFAPSGLPARRAMASKEELLHIPVFSTNTLTVGVGVSKEETAGDAGVMYPINLSNTRFVSNSENRSLFLVKNSPESNTITITFSQLTSMTATKCIRVQFDRGGFCQAIESSDSCVNWNQCFQFVNFIHEETCYRACPICKSSQLLDCGCCFPLTTPTHPFDFFPFMTTMIQDFGVFEGVAKIFTYCQGRLQSSEVCDMRESSADIIAPDIINHLSEWSLSQPEGKVAQANTALKHIGFEQPTRSEYEPELQFLFAESDDDMSPTDKSEATARRGKRLRLSTLNNSNKTQRIEAPEGHSFDSSYGQEDIVFEHRSGSSRTRNDASFEDLSEAAKILKHLKAVERRDRNRAAATKSNRLRREMGEHMRAEIRQGKEKIAWLRVREMHLRKEREMLLEAVRYF